MNEDFRAKAACILGFALLLACLLCDLLVVVMRMCSDAAAKGRWCWREVRREYCMGAPPVGWRSCRLRVTARGYEGRWCPSRRSRSEGLSEKSYGEFLEDCNGALFRGSGLWTERLQCFAVFV